MKDILPLQTVVRLSRYRQLLLQYRHLESPHIYSHGLARLSGSHPVQVRRDLMLIGFSGNHRKGYNVNELIDLINRTLEHGKRRKLAIVGYGRLGRALLYHLEEQEHMFSLAAIFEIDPVLTGKEYAGVPCYHINEMEGRIRSEGIEIVILAFPDGEEVAGIVRILAAAGISGILNFIPGKLETPPGIYMKGSELITMLDEVSYFATDRN